MNVKNLVRACCLALALGLGVSVFAQAGGTNMGSGGDEIRIIFEEARLDAAQKVAPLKRCSFPVGTPDPVKDWILENKFRLMEDIERSPHQWITDHQVTCAFTQTHARHPITLSFQACRNITTRPPAGRLLVHESVHHFGISDEQFADQVAIAVYSSDQRAACPEPSDDPFEPTSCTGAPITENEALNYFKPGTTETGTVGNMSIHARKRYCHSTTGCAEWIDPAVASPKTKFGFLRPVHACTDCGSDPKTGFEDFGLPNVYGYEEKLSFRMGLGGKLILDMEKILNYQWPSTSRSYRFVGRFYDYKQQLADVGVFSSGGGMLVLGGAIPNGRYQNADAENKMYRVNLSGKLTNHCLRLTGSTKEDLPDGRYVEYQGVLFSRF